MASKRTDQVSTVPTDLWSRIDATIKTIGVKSNRDGIGARVRCTTDDGSQIDEVRSGGSYYSQNDLRIHFGLGKARRVKTLEIRWPSGQTETLSDLSANQFVVVKEGSGLVRAPSSNKK